jgi:hypothetical protein
MTAQDDQFYDITEEDRALWRVQSSESELRALETERKIRKQDGTLDATQEARLMKLRVKATQELEDARSAQGKKEREWREAHDL